MYIDRMARKRSKAGWKRRMGAAVRFFLLWIVPALVAAVGWITAWGWAVQHRVFVPYGLSIGFDQGVLVIEREYPVTLGYRYVATAGEVQTRLGMGVVYAVHASPAKDSTLRKDSWRWVFPKVGKMVTPGRSTCSWVSIPAAVPALILVAFSAAAWRGFVKRHRRGACRGCGYDLRGLSAGSVCPECGDAQDGARGEAGLAEQLKSRG